MGVNEDLAAFITAERMRFQLKDNNTFAQVMSQIGQYRQFLSIIMDRYQEASETFVKNTKAMQEAMASHPEDVDALHAEAIDLRTRLHLEIESFYLFAKIMLDKIARAIEYYYGPAHSLALDSHDDLVKRLSKYAAAKGMIVPTGLIEKATVWKKRVSDYRDYNIAHEKSPRTLRATSFDTDGRTRMVLMRLYPTTRDQQVESEPLDDLLPELDAYIREILDLLRTNHGKTNLKILEELL
jgi:hypothetical protein